MSAPEVEHPLAIYRSGRDARWPEDAQLDLQLGDVLRNELMWAVRARPSMRAHLRGQTRRKPTHQRARDLHLLGGLNIKTVASKLRRRIRRKLRLEAAPIYRIQGSLDHGVLRLWTTENQRLALLGLGSQVSDSRTLLAPALTTSALQADDVDTAGEAGRRTGAAVGPILAAFGQAQAIRDAIEELLVRYQPQAVLTASTEHAFCRLAVSVARSLGFPSIYVPHAPTALNRIYADIPHDRAFLRGIADRDYYEDLGASPGAIEVVGDPTLSLPARRPQMDEPVILVATGANRPLEELSATLNVVRDSELTQVGRVVVSPHPREREEAERVARRYGFDVAKQRTSQTLAESNVVAMLVERTSGVALEALASGVPVFLLSEGLNYLFEADLDVPVIRGPGQLHAAVSRSAENAKAGVSPAAGSSRFLAATGEQAFHTILELAAQPSVASEAALDSWRWPSAQPAPHPGWSAVQRGRGERA